MSVFDGPLKYNLTIKSPPTAKQFTAGGYLVLYKWLQTLVLSLNDWIAQGSGTVNSRPMVGLAAELPPNPPSISGRSFFATDTKVMYFDDGEGNWRSVNLT